MNVKRALTVGMIVALIAGFAAPGMAMNRFDRIWLRDTLVGGAAGLGVGLLFRGEGSWLILGLIAGVVFGYFDAKEGLVAQDESASPWSPAPPLAVEARSIDGREQPEHIVKASVYQLRW